MRRSKTLYLIDDDTDDLDFFCEAVNTIDSSIICFKSTNSDETLQHFINNDVIIPDIIFLDLNMPLINGRKFLIEIKKLVPYATVPVIIYSTSSYQKDIDETKALGASDFLTKPYSIESLIKSLQELLSYYWPDYNLQESYAHSKIR